MQAGIGFHTWEEKEQLFETCSELCNIRSTPCVDGLGEQNAAEVVKGACYFKFIESFSPPTTPNFHDLSTCNS